MRSKPNQREAAIAAFTTVMTKSQQEPGCIVYRFTADLGDPMLFHVMEIWESEQALLDHFGRAAFADFMAVAGDLVDPLGMSALSGPLEPYSFPKLPGA